MKKQVERTVCDFEDCGGAMGMGGDVKCCLCRRDICYKHTISFGQSPSHFGGIAAKPKPHRLAFCVDCSREWLTPDGLVELNALVPSVVKR